MNAGNANLLNSVVLVGMGLWGYLGSATPSKTALIPVAFGVLLFVMTNFIHNHHKIVSHIAVVLTALILIALVKPFSSAMGKSDTMAMVRLGIMMLTSAVALFYFIKSFREARKSSAAK
ncbi:MAG: hypothetical protein HKO66_00045 [Saprospiraceae bacterium]|nr:hypothetical protein [Bacteroidia bacterium]NNE14842.1 hypothetical protein [Saprospiraceae bacterium]NNL90596.1 hypothetical protein [Saprospiraceae bacterium]